MLEESPRLREAKLMLDRVLVFLREERAARPSTTDGKDGKHELSEAITKIETGCMYVNRSIYADVPYSPIQREA